MRIVPPPSVGFALHAAREVLALCAVAALGCSNAGSAAADDHCPTTSKCPNDKTDPAACRAALADTKCGKSYRIYVDCAKNTQVCDGTGRTCVDRLLVDCRAEWSSYYVCSTGSAPDAAVDASSCDASPG